MPAPPHLVHGRHSEGAALASALAAGHMREPLACLVWNHVWNLHVWRGRATIPVVSLDNISMRGHTCLVGRVSPDSAHSALRSSRRRTGTLKMGACELCRDSLSYSTPHPSPTWPQAQRSAAVGQAWRNIVS